MTEPATLETRALNRALLARQHLLERTSTPAAQVVEHLVGLQAQIPSDPYIGLWTRISAFDPHELSGLIESRRAVRASLMRATIHLVTDDDYLRLRPVIHDVLVRSYTGQRFGKILDQRTVDAVLAHARELMDAAPRHGGELRDLLAAAFPGKDTEALGFATKLILPLVQVPPRGLWGKAGRPTWMGAEAWIGRPLDTNASVDDVVLRYLRAFGPASVADASRWSGLRALRPVFERLRPQLVTFRDETTKELFDVPDAPRPDPDTPAPVRFFPTYDNVSLSHADRSRIVSREALDGAVIGKPFFTLDGFVAGIWLARRTKTTLALEVMPFATLRRAQRSAVVSEATELGRFLDRERDVTIALGQPT